MRPAGRERLEEHVVEPHRRRAVIAPERLERRRSSRSHRTSRRAAAAIASTRWRASLLPRFAPWPADRIHRDRGVAERHHDAARRQPTDRRAHRRRARRRSASRRRRRAPCPWPTPHPTASVAAITSFARATTASPVLQSSNRSIGPPALASNSRHQHGPCVAMKVRDPERLAGVREQVELGRQERHAVEPERGARDDHHRELALRRV